jgi:hypothetical protein
VSNRGDGSFTRLNAADWSCKTAQTPSGNNGGFCAVLHASGLVRQEFGAPIPVIPLPP